MVFLKERNGQGRVPCHACPLRRLPLFENGAPEDIAFIQNFKIGETHLAAGRPIFHEDEESPYLFTLLEGWAFRFKSLPDGRRQIVNFVLRGDFIGLQNSLHRNIQHGVETLTNVVLCVFSRDRLFELFQQRPGLALDITWMASREERMLDDNLLAVGRRTALERTAHLIWVLFERAKEVGLATNFDFELPMSQQHLADALGMSLVHTNKTLKRLREMGVVEASRTSLSIPDIEKLRTVAKADSLRPSVRPLL